MCWGTPTPVFCKKRLDLLDCKGVDFFEEGKERQKRRQAAENIGFATETRRTQRSRHGGESDKIGLAQGVCAGRTVEEDRRRREGRSSTEGLAGAPISCRRVAWKGSVVKKNILLLRYPFERVAKSFRGG